MFTSILQFVVAFLVLLHIVAVETIALVTSIISVGDWLCVAVVLVGVRLLVREVRNHIPRCDDINRVRSVSAVPAAVSKKAKNAGLVAPLLAARTKFIKLRRSCDPMYWLTFLGQEEIRTLIKNGPVPFKSVLETIWEVEEEQVSVVVEPAKRRFLIARRPRTVLYGPFPRCYYEHEETPDDNSFPSTIDEDINNDGNKEESTTIDTSTIEVSNLTVAPKRRRRVVVSPSPPLRRSARLASQKPNKTQIVLGSILSIDGKRRSARLCRSCR